jgi:hypothetical protein
MKGLNSELGVMPTGKMQWGSSAANDFMPIVFKDEVRDRASITLYFDQRYAVSWSKGKYEFFIERPAIHAYCFQR